MENIKKIRNLIIISVFLSGFFLLMVKSARLPKKKFSKVSEINAQTSLRIPILLAYGFADANEQKLFLNTNAYKTVNVITGHTNKDASYFSQKGVLFAQPANASINPVGGGGCQTVNACTQYLVDKWKKSFDLNYQAVAIEELCSSHSMVNNAQAAALNQIRQLYPSKSIFARGTIYCSLTGVGYDVEPLLRMIKAKVNYFMPEFYFGESNMNQFAYVNTQLTRMESVAPGILDKTLLGLAMADTEDWNYDSEPGIEFKEFLDEEFHYLKTMPLASRIKGLAVYSYARSRPDNIIWLQQLFNHYYLQGKTTYYNPDDYQLQTIKNGSFEEGETSWQFSRDAGSSASIVTYNYLADSLNCKIVVPALLVRVPHPNTMRNCMVPPGRALFMNKGSGSGSLVSQAVNVSPDTGYVVDIYVKDAASPTREANFEISISGSQALLSSIVKEKSTFNSYFSSCANRAIQDFLWTKMKVFFTTGPTDTSITFTISDRHAPVNNKLVIDFVQMEKAKGQVPQTTPTPGASTPTKTPTPTRTPTPSSTPIPGTTVTSTPIPCSCPSGVPPKSKGNANCDEIIDLRDFQLWRNERWGRTTTKTADFNCDNTVDIRDFQLWLNGKWGR